MSVPGEPLTLALDVTFVIAKQVGTETLSVSKRACPWLTP